MGFRMLYINSERRMQQEEVGSTLSICIHLYSRAAAAAAVVDLKNEGNNISPCLYLSADRTVRCMSCKSPPLSLLEPEVY